MKDTAVQNGLGVPEADQKKALARYAAVCWVSERVSEEHPAGRTVQTVTAQAAQKLWDGFTFSAASIERYYYAYRKGGFNALLPCARVDKGLCRALSAEAQDRLIEARIKYPVMDATVLVGHMMDAGELQAGTFSMASVYRLFASRGVDRGSLKAGSFQPDSGPQKAFETALPNMLWMADMMYGPTIVTPEGRVMHTRLFALLDDHSRLCPHGEYFASEGSDCFMAVLYEAIRSRGLPDKLYTDNGKVFLCRHRRIVCANLGIKLSRARPYAAWSKGKIEKFFQRVQRQFQQTLIFDPVHSLGELNGRFANWVEMHYHQEEHRGMGEPPACRFMANSAAIRPAPADEDLRRLFLLQDKRRVRKDATVSIAGAYFELTPALRGQYVQVRYDPRLLDEIEIWHQDRFVQVAKRLDRNVNAKHYKAEEHHE